MMAPVRGEEWAGANEATYVKFSAINMHPVSSAFTVVLFVVVTVIIILQPDIISWEGGSGMVLSKLTHRGASLSWPPSSLQECGILFLVFSSP